MQAINQTYKENICANKLQTLHQNGISAIPLKGKQPHRHIKWKKYQSIIPPNAVAKTWYSQNFASYGIICGRVSQGLIVIDFDSTTRYLDFCNLFPDLTNTYTVKTRRGYHLYFTTNFYVNSRHFTNCDIVGDGGYVVGDGSIIGNHRYDVTRNIPILELTYDTYSAILSWLSPKPQPTKHKTLGQFNLVKYYFALTSSTGRNNALYKTARVACQRGYRIDITVQNLVDIYIHSEPPTQHKQETELQRRREALRTIKSAYAKSQNTNNTNQSLPNSIRESLLQKQNSTLSTRLLDAIQLSDYQSKWITGAELVKIAARFHIGKKSLFSILSGVMAKVNGKRIFKRFSFDKASYVSQGDNGKPNSNLGRPTRYIYRIPSYKYLCNILKVDMSPSDTLMKTDLYSAGAYRRALHRELVRRLSPMIRVSWFAERLNVSRRTIFRYNMQLQVDKQVMVQKRKLTLELATSLDKNADRTCHGFTPGLWLETLGGKRYPALSDIAIQLMRKAHSVNLCRQLPTRYTLDSDSTVSQQPIALPKHLESRATCLNYDNIQQVLSPDWATNKFDLGGYLAVYNGFEWSFRPPLRAIAFNLVKQYEDGLIYFIRPIKQ